MDLKTSVISQYVIILIGLSALPAFAQSVSPLGFRISTGPEISNANGIFRNAWAGGLNTPQFNQTDLNNDGKPDLILFDRSGNKLLTFVRSTVDQKWERRPEFEGCFPELHDWMLLRDYDGDGKEDIFTSAGNGISVYKNLGFQGSCVRFELVSALLESDYGNGNLNLYVSLTDIPAIEDMDGDGDLDILTFYILGTCLEYHKNLSVESSGTSTSLNFRLETDNWGHFTEDAFTNEVILNDTCNNRGKRHSGSALLAHDIDHDGDKDLLLGDISYPELLTLINAPENNTDLIIETPAIYPDRFDEYAVNIFPAPFRIYADTDTIPDLVIAPNVEDQSINTARLCKLYSSVAGNFDFTSEAETFLSHEMLDFGRSPYPVLADLDNDGDSDMLVGNYGEFEPSGTPLIDGNYRASLSVYENTGTATLPIFILRSNDAGNLRASNLKHLAPAVGDLNGDGRKDIVIGRFNGTLLYLRNSSSTIAFQYENSSGATDQIDAGDYATPAIADLNGDGKKDLLIGGKSGYFQIYFNSGSATQPSFPSAPDFADMGGAETVEESISNFGYSSPWILDRNNSLFLFSGSERGTVFCWKLNPEDFSLTLSAPDSTVSGIDEGSWSSVSLADLNGDGFQELITGNRRGGLTFYGGEHATGFARSVLQSTIKLYPNPASTRIVLSGLPLNGKSTISVHDLQGRTIAVCNSTGQASAEIPVNLIANGLYLIRISSGNQSVIQRIVISR